MPENRVNAVLSPEVKDEVMDTLKSVRQKLPFLIGLTKAQRKKLAKMGSARYDFVHRSLELAEHMPEILPRAFNVEDFRRDVDLLDNLRSILDEVTILREALDDTAFALANEAYTSARTVYQFAKADNGHGLDGTVREMGQMFKVRTSRRAKKAKSA